MANSIEDVLRQMAEHGLELPAKPLFADGKKATWAGTPGKPTKKNAWAILHEWQSPQSHKTFIVGVYGCGDQSNFWKIEPTQTEWSPAEKTAWLEKKKAVDKQADDERRALADAASTKAQRLWDRAQTDAVNPYLNRKQVGAYGVRFSFGKVLVPICDAAGKLHGLQWISEDGGKVFGTGTVKDGNFHLIGSVVDAQPVAFCEGYATAASVHMATGWPAVVCFDAGNLMSVVAAFRKLYPDHEFVIPGDDDKHLVARLCERLAQHGVGVQPKDFAKSNGGMREMDWHLPDARHVHLIAAWAKDRNDVYLIQGAITVDGVAHMLKLENAGRAKGMAAARKHSARLICPVFKDRVQGFSDWNDLHVTEGLEVVKTQLLAPPEVAQTSKKIGPTSVKGGPTGSGGGDGPDGSGGGGDGDGGPRLRFPYLTEKWEVKGIRENVHFALSEDPALHQLVRFNKFSHQIDKAKAPPWHSEGVGWAELDDYRLASYLADRHQLIVGNPITIQQAVLMAAHDHAYNPMLDYFEALRWDGVPRMGHWLCDVMGTEQSEYSEKAGSYFLMSMVARVFEPGCQMDYMLVLQGGQGVKKSSVLQILAGQYYAGGTFSVHDKDSKQVLQGRLLFNFNELDSMSRSESTAVKSFVTERSDVFRAPYAKSFSSYPRCCVLTGDTNQDDFLKDATGDRRCWPVHCADINTDLMAANRDQLFAEAVQGYKARLRRYPDRDEEKRLFQPQQDRWKFVDVWQDVLARYVNSANLVEGFDGSIKNGQQLQCDQREFFSTHELMEKALHQDVSKIDRAGNQQKAVGNAMKALGFRKHKWTAGRSRPNGYIRSLTMEEKPLAAGLAPAPAGQYASGLGSEGPAWD